MISSARGDDVEGPLGGPQAGRGTGTAHGDQRQPRHLVADVLGGDPELEQPGNGVELHRLVVAATHDADQLGIVRSAEGQDHVADVGQSQDLGQVLRATDDGQRGDVFEAVDEAARHESELGVVLERPGDVDPDGAGADDERVLQVVATGACDARRAGR